MQTVHDLFDRGMQVPVVKVIDIDVGGPESTETRIFFFFESNLLCSRAMPYGTQYIQTETIREGTAEAVC
jgi:hypothetical protein